MPVVRFVREGREVDCPAGTNLRELALAEGVELYGLKGRLGNCGGCGQCITCFVEVVAERQPGALSDPTAVEIKNLRRRPEVRILLIPPSIAMRPDDELPPWACGMTPHWWTNRHWAAPTPRPQSP